MGGYSTICPPPSYAIADDTRSKEALAFFGRSSRNYTLSTNYEEPIPPEQQLSLTLRHLATGESQISLSLPDRIGRQTISKIIPETCKAIYDALVAKYC